MVRHLAARSWAQCVRAHLTHCTTPYLLHILALQVTQLRTQCLRFLKLSRNSCRQCLRLSSSGSNGCLQLSAVICRCCQRCLDFLLA
jgi:hypothetical protein